MRHNRRCVDRQPVCMFCDKPLRPHLRTVWVSVPPVTQLTAEEFLGMAVAKLRGFLRDSSRTINWRSFDDRALTPLSTRESFQATLWVVGDFDGIGFIADRREPCFCNTTCASEFAQLAAASGFKVRP